MEKPPTTNVYRSKGTWGMMHAAAPTFTVTCAVQGYPELGEAAFGVAGRRLVTVAAAIELFGGSCMIFIILWATLQVPPLPTVTIR